MNDLSTFIFLLFLLLLVIIFFSMMLMPGLRRKIRFGRAGTDRGEIHSEEFKKRFFSAFSEVVFAHELRESISSIASGIMQAFGGDTFIFKRDGESASLVGYAVKNVEQITNSLVKAGLRLDVGNIPLSRGRAAIFEQAYSELGDPFQLIDDLVTSAICRKIQRELRFSLISSVSVPTSRDSGDYVILVLMPERIPDTKRELDQFGMLLKSAVYLSDLKNRLGELESRFDEQFIRAKNELREKEGTHLSLFNEMPIPAAVLDERGVITEPNEALRLLFEDDINAVGQPLSSIMGEEERQNFIETLLTLAPDGNAEVNLHISSPAGRDPVKRDKHYKAQVVSRKTEEGKPAGSVVYLLDETADVSLRRELERTIDTLRAENELAGKIAAEERKHTEEIIRGAGVPMIAVYGEKIELASDSAKQIFTVHDGQLLEEFASQNDISNIHASEATFKVTASHGKTFAVSQWEGGPAKQGRFYIFNDVTELKKLEAELRNSAIESSILFNSLLPTARVKEDWLVEWNDGFQSLARDFLSSDKSFDGFLRYLGESPEACKSELRSNNIIMRACRTTDRKFLNMSAAVAEDSIFVFVEDITEQENVKQRLRSTQGLLTSSLESFSEEPVLIVENGILSAANLAARGRLDVRLDEAFNIEDLLTSIGASRKDETVELNGKFFRVETAALGSSIVYHFRMVTEEIAQRAEINRLKRRQELLRELATSERYENILTNVNEILKIDGTEFVKLVSVGTLQCAKEIADVYLLTVSSGKIEPSLSLSLSPPDISNAERGGVFSNDELPDTTFANVVSAGDSTLAIQSTAVGDVLGFASAAVLEGSSLPTQDGSLPDQSAHGGNELNRILKTASSAAVGIHTRLSAESKFEESGKIKRALVGLTGIGEGKFEEFSRNAVDLLKRALGAESVGIYSVDGAALAPLAVTGSLPDVVSIPSLKFGVLLPSSQLEGGQMKTAEGHYFALRSRWQKLALIFKFVGAPTAPSELNAISSIALDLLESKRTAEEQSAAAAQLSDESSLMNEFMTRLAKSKTPQDVLKVLGDSLRRRSKDATVAFDAGEDARSSAKPLEIVRKGDGDLTIYEANLLNFGVGIVTVKCPPDTSSSTMVKLAVDKMRSLLALKLPAVQNEAADLRNKLEKAKDNYAGLRESVDKIPISLKNARIEIDGALSRLSYVQGDERIIQEIKLNLASAAKELSLGQDSSSRTQDDIFEAVRMSVTRQESAATRIRNFDVSVPTEFRTDQAASDLIKDIFVNFVVASEVDDCEVLMMTAQPSPKEVAEGKGKRISMKLTAKQGEISQDDIVKGSGSIQTLAGKLRKRGYQVDTRALGNELAMDIFEVKTSEVSGERIASAILVEDDSSLAEEESQNLLHVFSRLKVAGDAVEAAKILESEKFDAAMVDLSLPSINGRELCQQIKKSQPDCVTILLTNREGEEKSEGVDHIMLRPLDEETVRSYFRK